MHNGIPATDSCQPKIPQPPSFPPRTHNRGNPRRRRESTARGRRWVPVSTGTTGAPTIVIPAGIHGGDGFPSPRERRPAAHPNRHSRDRRESSCPAGTAGAGGDGFPSPRERSGATHNRHSRLHGNTGANPRPTHIVIPAQAGIHGGGPAAMGSRLHGNDGPAAGAPTIVIPATARIHGPTSSFPRTAGIHGGGPAAMGSRLWQGRHGNVRRRQGAVSQKNGPTSMAGTSRCRRRESAAARREGSMAFPSPRDDDESGAPPHNRHSRHGANPRRQPQHRHSRAGGNPRRGAGGDGFPSPRERRAHPQSSFPPIGRRRNPHGAPTVKIVIPATAGIHGGGPAAMGSRLHGNDGRTHNRHSRHGGNPRPHIVIPAQAGIHGGGPAAMGSRLHHGRTHEFPPRRARPHIVIPATAGIHGGAPAAMGSRLHGNDGPAAGTTAASGIGVLSDRMAPLRGCEVTTWATKA